LINAAISSSDVVSFKGRLRAHKGSQDKLMKEQQVSQLREVQNKLVLDVSKLTILELLGRGSYGHVYRAQYEKKNVVVKQLIAQNHTNATLTEELKYEALMLMKADSIGVLKIFGLNLEVSPPQIIT
jgi:hypothetical protein